jgi:hypothetical protein
VTGTLSWRGEQRESERSARRAPTLCGFGSPGGLPVVGVGGYDEGVRYSIVEYDGLAIRNPSPRCCVGERHRVVRSSLWVATSRHVRHYYIRSEVFEENHRAQNSCGMLRRHGTIHGNGCAERMCVEQQRATRFGTNSGGNEEKERNKYIIMSHRVPVHASPSNSRLQSRLGSSKSIRGEDVLYIC